MSATSGRDVITNGELATTLDAKGNAIINADLTGLVIPPPNVPTIDSTTLLLKGDSAGNAITATPKVDYWDTTDFTASGSSAARGLVPAPPGTPGTAKFLREDKTWASPPAAGTIPSTSALLKGDGSGNASAATVKTDYWDGTVFVASGTGHAKGLVPDPGASAATTHYLREDGTWAIPPASAGVTVEVTSLILKGDGAGGAVHAVSGTDYVAPSTALTRLTAATTVLTGSTPAVNWQAGTSFSQTITANTTYTFSNVTDGWNITLAITNTGAFTVAWPAGIVWSGSAAPTMTTGAKTDFYGFDRKGSVTFGAYIQNMS